MLRAVLEGGGHPHRKDNEGATPDQVAVSVRRLKVTALLQRQGAG